MICGEISIVVFVRSVGAPPRGEAIGLLVFVRAIHREARFLQEGCGIVQVLRICVGAPPRGEASGFYGLFVWNLSNCSSGRFFVAAGKMLLTANRGALNMRPVLEMGL